MSDNPEFEETENFPWEEEMSNFRTGYFIVTGIPQIGDEFDCGAHFYIVSGDEPVTPAASVAIGDITTTAQFRQRLADAISDPATDSNCSAGVSGQNVITTPNVGVQPGSIRFGSAASNMQAVIENPDTDGVYVNV